MALICRSAERRPDIAPEALHTLRATPQTIHWGYFDPAIAPALRVRSGDLVQAQAVTHHAGDDPDLLMDDSVRRIFAEVPESDRNPGVHIMTGPIWVEDAKPGDMLEVRYLSMTPRFRYGSNLAANWGYLYKEFDEKERVTIYRLDENGQTAHAHYAYDFPGKYMVPGTVTRCPECDREKALEGIRVPVRPHLGTAGVAPDIAGRTSTIPPGLHGGNIDNWRIGAGAVSRDVLMQVVLRKDFGFRSPLLETPKNWIVHGFHEDLNQAMRDAALDMLELLTTHRGLSRNDAYSLMSVAADFGVTQVVDGRQGVHVRIARDIFPMLD